MFIDALIEEHEVVCVAKGCEGKAVNSSQQLKELYERPIMTRHSKPRKAKKTHSGRSRLGGLLQAAGRARRILKVARRDECFFATLGRFDCILCVNSARLLGCVRYRNRFGGKLVPCLFEIWSHQRASYSRELSRYLAGVEKRCLLQADKVIVPHRSWWRQVRLRYGLTGIAWAEIPNVARDDNPGHCPAKMDMSDAISLYYQGRLATARGLEGLVGAVAEQPGVSLHLRGTGGAEQELRRRVEEAGVQDRVRFYDPISPGELVDSCKQFNVGVVSFLKDSGNGKFGIGSKFFEYIAAGNAVLVPDSWPLKDWVMRYDLGRVYRAGDQASLTRTLEEIANAPEQVQAWRENVVRAAQTDFSFENICQQVRDEIRMLL